MPNDQRVSEGKEVASNRARLLPPDQVLAYFLHDLDEVEEYSRFTQIWCSEELERYERYIRDDDTDDERYDGRRDMHVLFKETFSVIGRHTVVVYLFSALEDNLNEFCNAVQRRFGLPSGVREANGKGLDRVKTYLKPTAVGFPSDEPFWSPIKSAQQTRDVLTHCLGYLNVDNPKHIDVAKYINQRRVGTVERGTPALSST